MTGVARCVWLFTRDPENEDQRLMLLAKGNLTKNRSGMRYRIVEKMIALADGKNMGVPVIEWLGECNVKADTVLDRAQAKERGKRGLAKTFLQEFLADGARESEEIFKEGKRQRVGRSTLFDAKGDLGIRAIKIGATGGGNSQASKDPVHADTYIGHLDGWTLVLLHTYLIYL